MLCFARPVFQVDINAMNSLSAETVAAERTLQRVWGDLTSRVYLMTEGRSLEELQAKSDRLAGMLREDLNRGTVEGGLCPCRPLPGGGAGEAPCGGLDRPSGHPAGWRISGGSSNRQPGKWGSPRMPSGPL